MLAVTGAKPFQAVDWVYEPKLDGYRMLGLRNGDQVGLISRGGADFTGAFPAEQHARRDIYSK
ncbi:MAG TPA: hypothetical protein VFF81_12150 [Noviherbaspirillum sp.]|nr:hypothetical protein [Noviherbaspirillum sp.]